MNFKTADFNPLSLEKEDIYYGCEHPSVVGAYLSLSNKKGPHVITIPESEFKAAEESLSFFNPEQKVFKLPALDPWFPSKTQMVERIQWLNRALSPSSQDIFLCSKKSLYQKTLPPNIFKNNTLVLTKNSPLPSQKLLYEYGYTSSFPLEEPGFYHQKGGILDIFSPAHPLPIRLEAAGGGIESIRFFNPKTLRNLSACSAAAVTPAYEAFILPENKVQTVSRLKKIQNFPSYLLKKISQGMFFPEITWLISFIYSQPAQALDFFQRPPQLWILQSELQQKTPEIENSFDKSQAFYKDLIHQFYFKHLDFSFTKTILHSVIQENKNIWPMQIIKNTKTFSDSELWNSKILENYFSIIAVSSEISMEQIQLKLKKQGFEPCFSEERFWSDQKAEQIQNPKKVHLIQGNLPYSFKTQDSVFLKDRHILKSTAVPSRSTSSQSLSSRLKALHFSEIKKGDLIIDKIHGVGRYKGLKNSSFGGIPEEYIEIEYKNQDRLYIPVSRLNRLFQFKSSTVLPMLDQLGQTSWKQKLSKAQKSIQNLVLELLKTYQARSCIKRPAFGPAGKDLIQFEKEFPFEETPDQLQAIADIYADMQKDRPMERLIIGDSGYGKTETAMRAVFKAAEAGFQTAFIAPTTILSLQHFESFKKRFQNWPIRIELFNRLSPSVQAPLILKNLQKGKIDVLIGSHRILSPHVQFKNLGLIIIDEEHRFGVRQKEKLKKLKLNADCIYMSATPIPRTLSIGLCKAKDMSLIQTPPKNRTAPQVFIMPFQTEKIKKAVEREIQRGGQVIFVHNRIKTIDDMHDKLSNWLPNIVIQKAHGQMNEKELEDNILKFFRSECDLLLCTSIVESGMDFARSNTIIVNNAHLLGLSQLYQLKGRVGRRSSVQPYCYFIIPEHLPEESPAVSRLNFMQTHSYLGSGYAIARHDLEMRGGGEFLGSRQSGHIADIGYDLFAEMLNEELQPNLSKNILSEVKLPWPAYIPDSYIPHDKIRLMYYKYLCLLKDTEKLEDLENELKDAFGPVPSEVKNLFGQIMIQHLCQKLKIKELKVLGNTLHLTFISSEKVKIKLEEKFLWTHIYEYLQKLNF